MAAARVIDVLPLPSTPPAVIAFLQVQYRDTEPVTYVLPLTTDADPAIEGLLADNPDAAIARLIDAEGSARLIDATVVPGVYETLLGVVTGRRRLKGAHGDLSGRTLKGLKAQLARRDPG